MLIIISDLHLTDGSSGTTIGVGAFEIFKERITNMAFKASFKVDDSGFRVYQPVEEVNIILLGDILDIIRSSCWNEDAHIKPWTDPNDPAFIQRVTEINDSIIANNKEVFHLLKNLTSRRTRGKDRIALPDPRKVNARSLKLNMSTVEEQEKVNIPVNMYYMVGNHDWFYRLPGPAYDNIRKKIVEAMGLANDPAQPFPHSIEECPELEAICKAHRVYPRHGDIYDPFNFDDKLGRNASSLGDAIVVEILNRFPTLIEEKLGDVLPPQTLSGLREIDNVRPLVFIPVWINGLLKRTCPQAKLQKAVQMVWNELADEFLDLDFIKEKDTLNPLDSVDMLQLGLKISKKTSFKTMSKVISWFGARKPTTGESYYKEALKEKAFKNGDALFIVFGHTHFQEVVPLALRENEEQIYLNAGTWRQVFELTRYNRREHVFLGYQVMTYLGFFKEGERKGRRFEVWSGSLGEKCETNGQLA